METIIKWNRVNDSLPPSIKKDYYFVLIKSPIGYEFQKMQFAGYNIDNDEPLFWNKKNTVVAGIVAWAHIPEFQIFAF